jgi:hypothetical protein
MGNLHKFLSLNTYPLCRIKGALSRCVSHVTLTLVINNLLLLHLYNINMMIMHILRPQTLRQLTSFKTSRPKPEFDNASTPTLGT